MLSSWKIKIFKDRISNIPCSGNYLPIIPQETTLDKCNECTKCCGEGGVQLFVEDIKRIQKKLRRKSREYIMVVMVDTFRRLYNVGRPSITISLKIDRETKKCVFLSEKGCLLYPARLKEQFGTDDLDVFQKTKEILNLNIEQDPRPYPCKIYPFYLISSNSSSVKSSLDTLLTGTPNKLFCYSKSCPSVSSNNGKQNLTIDWNDYQKFIRVYENFTNKTKKREDLTLAIGIDLHTAFFTSEREDSFYVDLPESGRYEVVDEIKSENLLNKIVSIFKQYDIDY